MKSLRIHYLQHVAFEGLGYIETWANENNHILTATKFYEDFVLPEIADFDWLIVMGGPMGVYDELEFSWLEEEKLFIKKSIEAEKKVVGICLGAQLIACCLGAEVMKAKNKEIGWFPVFPTDQCKKLSWFYELFKDNPIVFHWHGDQFEIPTNCSNILVSEANTNQAFSYGDNVIGLQFHLEVSEQTTELMLENGKSNLINSRFVQSLSDIEKGIQHIGHCNKIMKAILEQLSK
ncbi:MAG: type 1 glutamine amidotransferase [Cyclobacteriaceae bacterium]|nr:MAG: type 1 glutamine amidotransferase [Cyclobacteriaceae bacterium]